jgi:hypothetical protein
MLSMAVPLLIRRYTARTEQKKPEDLNLKNRHTKEMKRCMIC